MDLRVAIYRSILTPISTPISVPSIEQIHFQEFPSLKKYIDINAKTLAFIILVINPDPSYSQNDFEELRQKSNVFAILICVKSKTNFSFIADKVYPVTQQFVAYQLRTSIITFFRRISSNFLTQNNPILAMHFKRKADQIERVQPSIGSMFEACDVLIIRMNVSEEVLHQCFSDIIDICNDLCPDNEPIVRLIDNYFPLDENTNHYDDDYLSKRLNFLKKMGSIRLFLYGNETTVVHPLSKLLYDSETTNGSDRFSYDENCTCIEYEPIDAMKIFIRERFMQHQQHPNHIPFRQLSYIRNDIHFVSALNRARSNREGRVLTAINELNQQSNKSVQCSETSKPIDQPDVNSINSSNEQINTSIQCSLISLHHNN